MLPLFIVVFHFSPFIAMKPPRLEHHLARLAGFAAEGGNESGFRAARSKWSENHRKTIGKP